MWDHILDGISKVGFPVVFTLVWFIKIEPRLKIVEETMFWIKGYVSGKQNGKTEVINAK